MAKTSIKIRAKQKGDTVTVKALMTHPMETGTRKDKKTGKMIPAHYIQEVKCEAGGKAVMTAYWNGGVSKNPYISFKFKGNKGDMLKLTWVDNQGNSESAESAIG
jgi:sulfur-oxidizing protein SoxZ